MALNINNTYYNSETEERGNGFEYFDGAVQTLTDGTTITVRGGGYFDINCPTFGEYRYGTDYPLVVHETPDVVHDLSGKAYSVGDYVAVAIVSDRSPQLMYGQVTGLSSVDKGHKPVDREVGGVEFRDGPIRTIFGRGHRLLGWRTQIQPLVDARNFGRWSDRKNTYKFCGNVIAAPNFKPVQ